MMSKVKSSLSTTIGLLPSPTKVMPVEVTPRHTVDAEFARAGEANENVSPKARTKTSATPINFEADRFIEISFFQYNIEGGGLQRLLTK